MDWDLAIKRNSEALKSIVAKLFAMLGLEGEAGVGRIPQALHSAVLRVLRPAESAMRRLIIIAARGVVVELKPAPSRPISPPRPKPVPKGPVGKGRASPPSFQLFDPRKNFTRRRRKGRGALPRMHIVGGGDLWGNDPTVASLWEMRRLSVFAAPPPPPDGLVNSACLSRRLRALKLALEDLPRQAKRLARWRVKRENMQSPKFRSPLRPGRPPGYRRKPIHEVDEVLTECHGLAHYAMQPNTS